MFCFIVKIVLVTYFCFRISVLQIWYNNATFIHSITHILKIVEVYMTGFHQYPVMFVLIIMTLTMGRYKVAESSNIP